jgi:hypothetical protein
MFPHNPPRHGINGFFLCQIVFQIYLSYKEMMAFGTVAIKFGG